MYKILIIVFACVFSISLISCEGCTRSGRRKLMGNQNEIAHNQVDRRSISIEEEADSHNDIEFIVKMTKESGVFMVPVDINGTNMKFIFDTGASDITISDIEALFLYKQGKLLKEDILGTQQYQIADGSIAEGTIINLRTVKIGGKTLKNVKASIVHNTEAPLLLGQSALARFGKVSIDYGRGEITFE